jgi:cytochrome c peroxidase
MKNAIIVIIIILFITQAFTLLQNINFVTPQNWPKPSYNFLKNPLTEEKIELGRALFYEVRLSRNNTISCASCHSQYTSFTHVDHSLSHGIEDRVGLRNSQALVNLAWHKNFMWDGSINHLDMQALAPISNIDEMGEKIEHVVEKLESSKIYPNLFYKAFGDNKITGEKLLKSISQFLLTLVKLIL